MSGPFALVAEPPDRLDPRTNMFITAVLVGTDSATPVRVRDMSVSGALLEVPNPPPYGQKVTLRRGSLLAHGEVAWSANQRCGLRFQSAVNVQEWMARTAAVGQARIDNMVALLKAGAIPLAAGLNPTITRDLAEEAKEDLTRLASLLMELVDDLVKDQTVIVRHGSSLQNLDLALQIIAKMQSAAHD